MNNTPIVIIDDDSDDRSLLVDAWKELKYPHKLVFFDDGESLIHYLKSGFHKPFIIICDVNIPKMDGFELKQKLLEDDSMNTKSIPFVFWSTTASEAQIKKSYDLSGHGFFIKDNTFKELKESLIEIVNYWTKSKTPRVD